MVRIVIIADQDGAEAARAARAAEARAQGADEPIRTAVWIGEEGSPDYAEFSSELSRGLRP